MYRVKLTEFEGPLDLLLFFIKRDELDIYDIPISKITKDFLEYLKPKIELAQKMDINFAIETMYVTNNSYWLDSYTQAHALYIFAKYSGWYKPFIADVAHLQICKNFGTWTENQIKSLMMSNTLLEVHYSDNDKVHDVHKPYVPGKNNQIDEWLSLVPQDVTRVDEGRYKK